MTSPIFPISKIAPLLVQEYERYLPTAFDDGMTMLQKMNRIIEHINSLESVNQAMLDNWNALVEWAQTGYIADTIVATLNGWLSNGQLTNIALSRWYPVGDNALRAQDSVYLNNDANLFGYDNAGGHTNIGTVQQNNLLQFGDMNAKTTWFVTDNYHSLRAPNSPSYQKVDSLGNAVGAGRTIKHQENSSYHLRVFANGDHALTKNIYTDLHTLTDVQDIFPPASYNNFAYIIPREGMYHFNLQMKIKTAPLNKGAIRVAISKLSAGVTTVTDMGDIFYDPAQYATPFLNMSFDWKFKKDDQVTIKVNPLTENLVIENGTRLQIYVLGDTIQA